MLALGIISVFTAGICMARAKEGNDYRALQANSSIRSEQQVKSKHGNTTMENRRVRRGGRGTTHSIIFVGGKKTGKGSSRCCRSSATKSNPKQARKVRGALNPQPIPPGKQRQPEYQLVGQRTRTMSRKGYAPNRSSLSLSLPLPVLDTA